MNEIILALLVIGIISLGFGIMAGLSDLIAWALGWEDEQKEKRLTGGHPVKRKAKSSSLVYHDKRRMSR